MKSILLFPISFAFFFRKRKRRVISRRFSITSSARAIALPLSFRANSVSRMPCGDQGSEEKNVKFPILARAKIFRVFSLRYSAPFLAIHSSYCKYFITSIIDLLQIDKWEAAKQNNCIFIHNDMWKQFLCNIKYKFRKWIQHRIGFYVRCILCQYYDACTPVFDYVFNISCYIRNPSSENSVIALVSMSFDGSTDGIEPLQRIPSSTEMPPDLRLCVNARIAPVYTPWTLERGGTHSMALTWWSWCWSARSVKAE